MSVATVLRTLYPFFKLASVVYFFLVNLGFNIVLLFWKRRTVSRPTNDLVLMAAIDAAAMIRNGEVLSVQFIQAYIDRMNEVDGVINAVVEDNFDAAITKAKEVDAYISSIDKSSDEYKNLITSKPFLGVPFTTKDSVEVKGFRATAGIAAAADNKAIEDADVIKNMYEAGAIFLALTNVPEAACWTETFNTVFGRTNNPYDSRRSVGGSSGGEGAVLGSAASVIGIGTDIGGSIRIPSIMNGIFGLKLTPNLVSLNGLYPKWSSVYQNQMLSIGPMCRYAKDLEPLLRVLVGNDIAKHKLKLDEEVSLDKIRFFYMEGLNSPLTEPIHSEVIGALRKAVKYIETKCDQFVHRVDLPKVHHAGIIYQVSFDDRITPPLASVLTLGNGIINPFVESFKCAFGSSNHTLPLMFFSMLKSLPEQSPESKKYVEEVREKLYNEIVQLLGNNGILFFPPWPTTAPPHYKNVASFHSFLYTGLWNALRLPAVVCPMGLDSKGIPLSVQLVGAPHSEKLLTTAALELEKGFGGWISPSGV